LQGFFAKAVIRNSIIVSFYENLKFTDFNKLLACGDNARGILSTAFSMLVNSSSLKMG